LDGFSTGRSPPEGKGKGKGKGFVLLVGLLRLFCSDVLMMPDIFTSSRLPRILHTCYSNGMLCMPKLPMPLLTVLIPPDTIQWWFIYQTTKPTQSRQS